MASREVYCIKSETCALHTDGSGRYTSIRELVVAVVNYANGKPMDWAAYRAFVPTEMPIEVAAKIIADHGDKMYGPKAIDLLKYCHAPIADELAHTYYRE